MYRFLQKKILDTKIPNKAKNLQIRNFSLLEQLDKLNAILDTMIERKRFTKKKNNNMDDEETNKIKNISNGKENIQNNNPSSKEINNKLLKSFEKPYNLLTEKYNRISKGNYALDLKKEIESLSTEIEKYEKENRELKSKQFRVEFDLTNQKYIKENNLKYVFKIFKERRRFHHEHRERS